MRFTDTLTIDGARKTARGHLIADARISRVGLQLYSGAEVEKPEIPVVRVYRPEAEVFHADALQTVAHKAVTDDHPTESVTAANWRRLAVGFTGDQVARDGGYVKVPMMITDAAQVAKWDEGKRELSVGYDCALDWTPGVTPDGLAYDAVQRNIRVDHVAIVEKGRAGASCRIGDGDPAPPETGGEIVADRKMMVDGFGFVTVGDEAEAAIRSLQDRLKDSATALTTATTTLATRDAELVTVRAEHATAITAKDAEITAAKAATPAGAALDALVTARTALVADAQRLHGPGLTVTGLSDADLRKAVVGKRLGDAALKDAAGADLSPETVATMFATILSMNPAGTGTAPATPPAPAARTGDALRDHLGGAGAPPAPGTVDADQSYEAKMKRRQQSRGGAMTGGK